MEFLLGMTIRFCGAFAEPCGSMYRPDPDQDEVFSSVVFPALPLHLSPLYTATRWGDLW